VPFRRHFILELAAVAAIVGLGCPSDPPPAAESDPPPVVAPVADAGGGAAPKTGVDPKVPQTAATKKKGGLAGLAVGIVTDAKEAAKGPWTQLPASTRWLVHVELAPLRKSPMFDVTRDLILKSIGPDDDAAATARRLRTCKLEPDALERITLAISSNEHAVAIAVGEGFGVADNYACLATELRKDGKPVEFELTGEGEQRVLVHDGDHAYFLADDTVMMADKELDEEVAVVRKGTGESAATGPLAPLIEKVTASKQSWMVMANDGTGSSVGSGAMSKAIAMWGTATYDGELSLSWVTEAAGTADGREIEAQLESTLGEFKGVSSMLGLPSGFESKVKLERDDKRITLSVTMDEADLKAIDSAFRRFGGL
jgi:hypothetical protein